MWEDLCQLEGSLGMRYLTHETEDNFWTSHGAKPHPLAKAEAEKRTQMEQQQQRQQALQVSTSGEGGGGGGSGIVLPSILPPLSQLSNGSQVSNGSANIGNCAMGVSSPTPSPQGDAGASEKVESPGEKEAEAGEGEAGKGKKNRKDYISMSDEEIIKAQAHAQRVGYKVSTV